MSTALVTRYQPQIERPSSRGPRNQRAAMALFMAAFFSPLAQGALYAQEADSAPLSSDASVESPTLALPDMEAEVRSIAPKGVDAPVPVLPDLPLPDLIPPLPSGGDLAIPASAYATEVTLDTQARPSLGETFTEASVGAGLMNASTASLSIYRPESDPSFSMTFSHDSMDGFAFNSAGDGYYERTTSLSGRVRGNTKDGADWSVSGAFSDEGTGLQGQSDYFFGVSHRYLDAVGTYDAPLRDGFSYRTSLNASTVARTLDVISDAYKGANTLLELQLSPDAVLEWASDAARASFDVQYGFRGVLDKSSYAANRIQAKLEGSTDLSPAVTLGASAAVASSTSFSLLFPFSMSIQAALTEALNFSAEGGLASDPSSLAELWKANPYMDAGEAPPDDARWFGNAKLDYFIQPGFTARTGLAFAKSLDGGGRVVSATPTGVNGLYTYTYEEYTTLTSELALRYMRGGLLLSIGWDADWLDEPDLDWTQRVHWDMEYRDREEKYGGAISTTFGFSYDDIELPIIDASAFVRLKGGVRLIAELRDIATAFSGTDGRVRLDPYIEPGFRADARVQLSL